MSGLRKPLFPAVGDSPDMQRVLNGVRELARFAARTEIETSPRFSVPTGQVRQLYFGTLNRLVPPYGGIVAFPAINSANVNVPLYLAKTVPTGVVTILSGSVGLDGRTPSLVNGTATGVTRSVAGLQVWMNDGLDWWGTA
jgi:hypothetical protein